MSEGVMVRSGEIRLLLVDDEYPFADALRRRLSKRDIRVTIALDGSEGIRALRRAPFDVAVLDLKMTHLDGIEVLKIFREMDPDLPVIMLTGHGSETAARDGMRYGAFDYLTKPCDLDALLDKIHRALSRKRPEEEKEPPEE